MADATDSKSVVRKGVWVRIPPRALLLDGGLVVRADGGLVVRLRFLLTGWRARRPLRFLLAPPAPRRCASLGASRPTLVSACSRHINRTLILREHVVGTPVDRGSAGQLCWRRPRRRVACRAMPPASRNRAQATSTIGFEPLIGSAQSRRAGSTAAGSTIAGLTTALTAKSTSRSRAPASTATSTGDVQPDESR